ncbi:MAG: hypothetical protein IJ723_00160, partial [Ruminococcus sp.]|nr:hypothetical protein [Ruminococcus sp.]
AAQKLGVQGERGRGGEVYKEDYVVMEKAVVRRGRLPFLLEDVEILLPFYFPEVAKIVRYTVAFSV